jgi:hypothetical protein
MIAFFFGLNKRIVELNLLTNDKIKKKKKRDQNGKDITNR